MAERGEIESPVGEWEVRCRCALVCLLLSTRIFDSLQSLESMGDPIPSNQSKLVASRVTNCRLLGLVLNPSSSSFGLALIRAESKDGSLSEPLRMFGPIAY
jgi:hypothetical protein